MEHAMMSYPAPRRMSVEGPHGWYTAAWTEEAVREHLKIGGFFLKGRHDFENILAARAAGVREE